MSDQHITTDHSSKQDTDTSSAIQFTVKDVEQLAQLSRLSLSQEEKETYASEISGILGYISQIQDVSASDTGNRTSSDTYPHRNVMRDDVAREISIHDHSQQLVDLAPRHVDGYVQVKKILGSSE
jgi:aspartyl-tRNA(Asn)/glutamyl-tRNA(Gln) amidotransferase subunit C